MTRLPFMSAILKVEPSIAGENCGASPPDSRCTMVPFSIQEYNFLKVDIWSHTIQVHDNLLKMVASHWEELTVEFAL